MTRETTLYRFFDGKGTLLYVGITTNLPGRWAAHKGEKPWWSSLAEATLEHFPTREKALVAELRAIRKEQPRFNLAGRVESLSQPAIPVATERFYVQGWSNAPRAVAVKAYQERLYELSEQMKVARRENCETWLVELMGEYDDVERRYVAEWGEDEGFVVVGGESVISHHQQEDLSA